MSNKKRDHNYMLLLFLLFVFIISFTFYACFLDNQSEEKIDVGEEDSLLNQSNTSNNNEDFKSESDQDNSKEEMEEETTEEDEKTDLEDEKEIIDKSDNETSEEDNEIGSSTVKVYYADSNVQYLVGEERIISGAHKYLSIFMELLKSPLEPGHINLVPKTTKVNKINFDNGNITLDLSPEFINDRFKSETVDILLVYSIVNTLTEFPEVDTVNFYIGGERLNTIGQLDISNPLYRDESWIKEN